MQLASREMEGNDSYSRLLCKRREMIFSDNYDVIFFDCISYFDFFTMNQVWNGKYFFPAHFLGEKAKNFIFSRPSLGGENFFFNFLSPKLRAWKLSF